MVPPAAAQRETGPWERKTDKTQCVRGAARPPGPSRGAPTTLPPTRGEKATPGGPGSGRRGVEDEAPGGEAAAPAKPPGGDESD